jgi:hypothetical protein
MKEEEENLMPTNSFLFCLKNEDKPIMKISKGKFYWKNEEIEDIYNIYERFNEWLSKTENK